MTDMAMPCIICDKQLQNVDRDEINQPHEGTTFDTNGHYGSTHFDPMDGSHLELNICDECLGRLTKQQKILFGRYQRPVVAYLPDFPMAPDDLVPSLVGWQKVKRELTIWNGVPDAPDEDRLVVEPEEIGTDAFDKGEYTVKWVYPVKAEVE